MIALLLAQNILTLFVYVFAGVVLVRAGAMTEADGRPLSTLTIYLLTPAVIIDSLQVDFSYDVAVGLALAVVAAAIVQSFAIGAAFVLGKLLGLNEIEKGSIAYTNSGNLLIPLIIATLGSEWVIYSLAYMIVAMVFMFTHLDSLIAGERCRSVRSIITNPNLIAVAVGSVLLLTGLRLPGPLQAAVAGLGGMLGPVAMLVAGISIGAKKATDVVANPRVWLTSFLRLCALPLVVCLILKFLAPALPVANATDVLLVICMAAAAPSASLVVQFTLQHGKDAAYASAINVVSTLCSIVSLPLIVALYTL